VLFASAADTPLAHPAEQRVPAALGGGLIRASVLPDVADQLIIGGLPRDRLPLLLVVFALSGALALLAVRQLRKETELARLRSDFVASVSHELRSPLAQVRLFVETLRLGRAPTDQHREWALANVDRETLRLAGLVENVLAFSRAERGGLAGLELQPGDVGDEVEAAVASFAPLVPPGRVALDVRVGPGLRALVHRDSLRQVLLNLLDNAVKYGSRGQTVRVEAGRYGDAVRIAVDDQGPGVAAADREAIFEPFRRGRATLEGGAVAGSGIGLSVVREIVRAHGGRAWVETGPEGGARFVVELPSVHMPGAAGRFETDAQVPAGAPEAA
jgi:signal transduction histidine kinase